MEIGGCKWPDPLSTKEISGEVPNISLSACWFYSQYSQLLSSVIHTMLRATIITVKLKRLGLFILFSHLSDCFTVFMTLAVSVIDPLNQLPRHFIGLCSIDGVDFFCTWPVNFLVTFTYLTNIHKVFQVLKVILAHVVTLSMVKTGLYASLSCYWDLSMKHEWQAAECWTPELGHGWHLLLLR